MKNIHFTLLLVFLSISIFSQKSTEQLLRLPYTSTLDQANREYFIYLPKGYEDEPSKEWPVLLFLHGNGERGNGMDELDYVMIHGPLYEAWIQKRDLPFIMIVPQLHMMGLDKTTSYIADRTRDQIPVRLEVGVPERPGFFGTNGPMNGVIPSKTVYNMNRTPSGWDHVDQDLIHMLDETLKNYNADNKRVYISGLSYGGFGTFHMASKFPERFAAMNPVVGWGTPEQMESIAKAQLPIWVFAAGYDTAVKWENFYVGLNKLKELGHKDVKFTIHEDLGHDAWKRIYGGWDIYAWLLENSK
ncbi:prolyl oligopeptidase family serine peptidase [Urechidicola vernalis]|uniref:Prolyl oligopeptidase family serine peptidase n=1 Tax=Urechidicola vernalis TaxID=3075600 RepID=A0ABU2Y2P9_9FLAO|nr:prolyl oligopeptidase family serine peptidase [Urechidicola sp. P050]MDT0552484.1 prolyl oligopeptidase family serine peptidase [Urechidicola sp. P050]